MNGKITQLKVVADLIRAMFPDLDTIDLLVNQAALSVSLHKNGAQYAEASIIMRDLGVGVRHKQIFDESGMTWTSLQGEVDGVNVRMSPDGLPPMCRKETYVEKVPKTVPTGEFEEVTKTKIVCH